MCLGTGRFRSEKRVSAIRSSLTRDIRDLKRTVRSVCKSPCLNKFVRSFWTHLRHRLRHRWHSDITSCIVPKISQVPCWTLGRDPWKLKPTARNTTQWCLQRASTTCPRKAEHQRQGRSRLDITRQQVGSTWHCDPSWPSHAGGPPWALPPAAGSVEPTFGTWKLGQQFLCQVPYPSAINPGAKQLRWSWKFENKWGHSFHPHLQLKHPNQQSIFQSTEPSDKTSMSL